MIGAEPNNRYSDHARSNHLNFSCRVRRSYRFSVIIGRSRMLAVGSTVSTPRFERRMGGRFGFDDVVSSAAAAAPVTVFTAVSAIIETEFLINCLSVSKSR